MSGCVGKRLQQFPSAPEATLELSEGAGVITGIWFWQVRPSLSLYPLAGSCSGPCFLTTEAPGQAVVG